MKRIGLIVNPIAGMGGGVGLKGTDSTATLAAARALGARPHSSERAAIAIRVMVERLGGTFELLTGSGAMGENAAHAAGCEPQLIAVFGSETSAEDTRRLAAELAAQGVDLLLFAGGDGTARDICADVDANLPVLGIPTGVKMHSAVYATIPRAAGEAAAEFLDSHAPRFREAEVMDIDEEAFRGGRVSAKLYGLMRVPDAPRFVQHLKSGSAGLDSASLAGIADDLEERMRDGALYIVGPGSTTRGIIEQLGMPKTLLGVDLYCRGEAIASDVTEQGILDRLNGVPARIVVTPIGGQGFIFGRGNQQVSAEVIRRVGKANVIVVATLDKIAGLHGEPLLVDTGDADLDGEFAGYIRVLTGYRTEMMCRVQ